jgi:hypothetical protein
MVSRKLAKSQSSNRVRIVNHSVTWKLSLLCDQIRVSHSMTLEFLESGGKATVTERAKLNEGTLIYTRVSARI